MAARLSEEHGARLSGTELFFTEVHLHGGPAPVRRFLPDLIRLIENQVIDPGKVFDLTLPLGQAANPAASRRCTDLLIVE